MIEIEWTEQDRTCICIIIFILQFLLFHAFKGTLKDIICKLFVLSLLNLRDIYGKINTTASSKNLVITSNSLCYTNSNKTDFLKFFTSRVKAVKWNLARSGFISCRTAVIKWSNHGIINLLIPGHDPPVVITMHVDIFRNPGPIFSRLKSNISQVKRQTGAKFMQTSGVDKITYHRSKLFDIRRLNNTEANQHS